MKNKKKFKRYISYFLCFVMGMATYPITEQFYGYYKSRQTYKEAKTNSNKYEHWITLSNLEQIDYPIAYGEGNSFHILHDIDGNPNLSGSIYFEESQEPYDNTTSILYGHSMKDGSMFQGLHKYKKDNKLFRDSVLTLRNGDVSTDYKPLGIYVTNNDWIQNKIDNMSVEDAVNLIKERADYALDVEYTEDSHIITLFTCEYTDPGNRLLVFYIN